MCFTNWTICQIHRQQAAHQEGLWGPADARLICLADLILLNNNNLPLTQYTVILSQNYIQ